MNDEIDIAEMAREAGVPADDPGVHRFAKLIASTCADICATAGPDGDADLVPAPYAKLMGRELSVKIRALFECD